MNYQYGILLVFFCLWQISQSMLSSNTDSQLHIVDRTHDIISFINIFLRNNKNISRILIIITSLLIDINVLYVGINCLWKKNYRPLYIMIFGLTIRQICQYINRLPIPQNMIWFHPGVPSILVTYDVSNDFFFSGHTFIAMLVGFEIIKKSNMFVKIYGMVFIMIEIIFVIVTNGHYFMDIYAAIATYFMLKYFVYTLSISPIRNIYNPTEIKID